MRRMVLSLLVLAACDHAVAPLAVSPVPSAPQGNQVTAPPPPAGARTVAQFDTTSAADRAAAQAPAPTRPVELGVTVAALGDPAAPGIWVKTPLVDRVQQGRVATAGGKSITVELRPMGAEAGSGSQISLPAMRLLGLGLTDLPELTVYRLP